MSAHAPLLCASVALRAIASLFFHVLFFFFLNDTPPTEIYTLSLHDALPIFVEQHPHRLAAIEARIVALRAAHFTHRLAPIRDRKSTRLNSSHLGISYAVFCLKKKKKKTTKR